MGDFYVTLISDDSKEMFPDNKIHNFKNNFNEPIRLEGEFEVALVECTYVYSSIIIKKGAYLALEEADKTDPNTNEHVIYASKNLKTWKDIMEDVNSQAKHYRINPIMYMSKQMAQFQNLDRYKGGFHMSDAAKEALGYSKENREYSAIRKNEIMGKSQIFIYCDIVDHQIVGGDLYPILRRIPYTGKEDEIITQTFKHLHYVDVKHDHIEKIWIYMKTENGQPPPFHIGPFTLTLHFRRKQ